MRMAGEAYIRVALSNLQRAMVEKQNQVAEIRKEITQLDIDRRHKKQEIESQINQNNLVIGSGQTDDTRRLQNNRQNARLEAEKSNVDHAADRKRTELEQQIRDVEDDWRGIDQLIKDMGGL